MRTTIAAIALTASAAAAGTVSPFTETFDLGSSNWKTGASTDLAWDASGFVSNEVDVNSAGPFGLTLFRGQDGFDSSGDAFVGNYLASGINRVSFDIRHDAGQALTFALRVATSNNFPGFAVIAPVAVESGVWTTLSFDLDFTNPFYFPEGAPGPDFFAGVMNQVGNLQISVDRPDGLDTPLVVNFDMDNFAVTPSPAGLGLLGVAGLAAARRRRG